MDKQINNNLKTIIIADDDNDDIELFEWALKLHCPHYTFYAVNSGPELFTLLEEVNDPHLIVLDINMPRMTGLECLQKLKADSNTASIPVVMLSTASRNNIEHKYVESGAAVFLTKPSKLHEFETMVGEICVEYLV